eukprot:472205_1
MAQEQQKIDDGLLTILKVDQKGWKVSLFENQNKMKDDYLCGNCSSVCCDPVELGCDHDDNDICYYCDACLNQLITKNNGKCPINSHIDPIISKSRAARRNILRSVIFCPYSIQYKKLQSQQNNVNYAQFIDTVGSDEKEGIEINNTGCQWTGKLSDLLNCDHLQQCIKKYDPLATQNISMNKLKNENKKLNEIIGEQREKIIQQFAEKK